MMRDIPLEIAGQEIKIRSDETEEYIRSLAAYVEKKIAVLEEGSRGVTTLNLALTAALTIADELHKARSGSGDLEGALDGLIERLETQIHSLDSQTA